MQLDKLALPRGQAPPDDTRAAVAITSSAIASSQPPDKLACRPFDPAIPRVLAAPEFIGLCLMAMVVTES